MREEQLPVAPLSYAASLRTFVGVRMFTEWMPSNKWLQ